MAAQINGIDKLVKKLNKLGGNSEKALEKGIRQATALVQKNAKELAPVDTGQLRNSIHKSTKKKGGKIIGTVGTNCDYAQYLEFGTGQNGEASPSPPKSDKSVSYRADWVGIKAQPFLYPSLIANKDNIKTVIAENLKAEIAKLKR